MNNNLKGSIALLLGCFLWGTAYPVSKMGLFELSALYFIGYRFLLGSLILAIIFYKKFKNITWILAFESLSVGILLFSGYLLEFLGLKYITAMKSSLLSSFQIILVPIIFFLVYKRKIKLREILSILLAFGGLLLLNYDGVSLNFNIGDFLTIGASIVFSIDLIMLSKLIKKYDSSLVVIIELFYVGILGIIGGSFFESSYRISSILSFGTVIYTGIFCTGLAYLLEGYAQRYVTPIYTGVIYATIPIFGMTTSWLVLGERFTKIGFMGGVIIIIAIINYNFNIFRVLKRNFLTKLHT